MREPGIAMILYTVREPAKRSFLNTLHRVRDSGFEYVQWSGMPDLPADEIRRSLDVAGLTTIAGHCTLESFEWDFEKAVQFWHTLGVRDLALASMMEDCRDSLEGWRRGLARICAVAQRLRDEGIRFSYHNHDFEFERFAEDARCKMDILLDETPAELVHAEFDTAWVSIGKADPATYLRRHAGRCPIVHVKDHKPLADPDGRPVLTELGNGVLDWPNILAAARESGVEWLIYEQDETERDVFESCRISFEFLRKHVGRRG